MIRDSWTMAWKEWRELFARHGRLQNGTTNYLLVLAAFGVAMPWQFGRAWIDSPTTLLSWIWVPLFLLSHMVIDTVAGERERHTLETLLASRLPDRAILLGKIGAAVGYGLAVTAGSLLTGLVTVNVFLAPGRWLFYPAATLIGALVVTVIGSTLTAALGVLVSIRAASVRQAGHMMGLAVLALGFSPLLVVRALSKHWGAGGGLTPMDMTVLGLIAIGCLVALDAGLLAAALVQFRRSRLIVD
jgi:ABC-2 type transport system permease protein